MMNNIDEHSVNLAEVAKAKDIHPIARLLAIELQSNEYLSTGDWLKSLRDSDVEDLMSLVDEDNDETYQSLIILALMLSRAESVYFKTEAEMGQAIGMLRVFICIESLARKGMVEVMHQNMSFGEDMSKLQIARKL